jgi:hypothetical protein
MLKAILIAISLAIVLSACGGGGGDGNSSGGGNGGGNTGGDQFGSGPDPSPDPSGNPTSAKLIAAGVTAGTITQAQGLIYEVYADFGDARLPDQYKGDDVGQIEGHGIDRAADYIVSVGEANVAPATLEALRPFITPPFYKGSWWQPTAPAGAIPAAATPTKSGWIAVPGANVVVWYKEANAGIDAGIATTLLAEYENTIWPKLTTLMGRTPKSDLGTGGPLDLGVVWTEDDARLDVFLDDLATGDGVTIPSTWRTKNTPARIFLKRTLPMNGLIATAAHEFMHAIQFSYDVKAGSVNDYHTTKEATAAWASHFVYPKNQWETKYAKYYLMGGQVSLSYDDRGAASEFRYGAYVFPLFLETRFGSAIVKGIWEKTLTFNSELFAIEGAIKDAGSNFSEEWRKFVAASWNRETIKTYVPFGVKDLTTPESDIPLSMPNGFGAAKHNVHLPHASMAYYRVIFSGNQRSLTFVNGLTYVHRSADEGVGTALYFTGMDEANRHGASMQVYLKVNGAWQSEAVDLSNVPWYSVCRDNPAGNIEEAIFMYGNGEISDGQPNYTILTPVSQQPGLIATDIGCRNWTGSLNMTRPLMSMAPLQSTGSETLSISNITLENVMASAAPTPGPGPAYQLAPGDEAPAGFGFVYKIAGGTATWNYNDLTTDCTWTGSKTFSIVGSSTPHITLTNWAPPGTASRGLLLPGLLTDGIAKVQEVSLLSAEKRCTNPPRTTTEILGGFSNDIVVQHLDTAVRIGSGGLTVSGTGAQASSESTGTWSFTGATN